LQSTLDDNTAIGTLLYYLRRVHPPSQVHLLRALLLVLTIPFAWATPSQSGADEIEHLLDYLTQSECQFNRNGTWYSAPEAAEHLRRKYEYLLKRDLVSTAESFIERAGSRSSRSGKPYLVRCGSAEPVASEDWFLTELARFREARPPA